MACSPKLDEMKSAKSHRNKSQLLFESVAIVISILLAFAIDAAWDERQSRLEEKQALAGLHTDFLTNKRLMLEVTEFHDDRASFHALFRSSTPAAISRISSDSANAVYALLYAPFTLDAVRGNVDALINTGRIGLLQNRELQERLITFINLLEDLGEERGSIRSSSMAVLDATVRHGGPWDAGFAGTSLPTLTSSELASIRQDKSIMGLIGLSHHWSRVYSTELAVLAELIEEILVLIESELNDGAT